MNKIYTHTLVRNGEPFIGLVLQQVLPYVEKMLVTISEKSTDRTKIIIRNLATTYPEKIFIDYENVENASELTHIRQVQIDKTPIGKWVLFLDSNDYWPEESLNLFQYLTDNKDIDALAFNPYQLIDKDTYDSSWANRWFTKLFLNQEGVHYEHPWPRDMLYKGKEQLYWKTNPRVLKVTPRFFHLDNLMPWRFRDQKGFEKYKTTTGKPFAFPIEAEKHIKRIYGSIIHH